MLKDAGPMYDKELDPDIRSLRQTIVYGLKRMYLCPTLPAFLSPNVLQYLVDTFDLRLISTAEDNLKTCLQQGI